jgi:hypothetical protein
VVSCVASTTGTVTPAWGFRQHSTLLAVGGHQASSLSCHSLKKVFRVHCCVAMACGLCQSSVAAVPGCIRCLTADVSQQLVQVAAVQPLANPGLELQCVCGGSSRVLAHQLGNLPLPLLTLLYFTSSAQQALGTPIRSQFTYYVARKCPAILFPNTGYQRLLSLQCTKAALAYFHLVPGIRSVTVQAASLV